jgi:dihydroneopterin aldolase
MTSILKEIYSKCVAQENDISKEITKIIDNAFPIDTIDRVKQKIKESIENYNNSIELLKTSIEKEKISKEEKDILLRKFSFNSKR